MAVKNIIFDMGGVLADFNPDRSLKNHFKESDRQLVKENTYLSREWAEMDRGTVEVEESVEIMCSRLPERLRDEARKMILDRETEMPPIESTYPVVETLHENGYKIYLLSNCPMWFYTFKQSIPAFRFFDGFIVSAEHKLIKPDEGLYRILFNTFNLVPEECFFIDDLEANIETGERLGMKVHCFADPDVEKLKDALRKEGVKI